MSQNLAELAGRVTKHELLKKYPGFTIKNAREIEDSPFFKALLTSGMSLELDFDPDIREGDLCLYHQRDWGKFRPFLATSDVAGKRRLFFTGEPENPRIPILDPINYRIARGIHYDVPPLRRLETEESAFATSGERYLKSEPPNVNRPEQLSVEVRGPNFTYHKLYRLTAIDRLDEIQFQYPEFLANTELSQDFLIEGKNGIPIIISDRHQKLACHIGQLIALRRLPNAKPLIDFIDEHVDANDDEYNIRNYRHLSSLEEISTACGDVDCGQASILLHTAGLADFRFFYTLTTRCISAGFGQRINPFAYDNSFNRTNSAPHLLSFDLDQLKNFCGTRGDAEGSGGLEETTTANYMRWLQKSGVGPENYDAVFLYTSPGCCLSQALVRDGIKAIVSLFS